MNLETDIEYTSEEYLKELSPVMYDDNGKIISNPDMSIGWIEESGLEQNKFGAWRMKQTYHLYTKEELEKKQLEDEANALLKSRESMSQDEVLNMIIKSQINTLTVDDQTSLRMIEFYPTFDDCSGKEVGEGYKFSHDGKLYKTVSSTNVMPDTFKDGLCDNSSDKLLYDTQTYTLVEIEHLGKIYDPIPYNNDKILLNGKYYIQGENVYLCNKDSVSIQTKPLKELVGVYVEQVEKYSFKKTEEMPMA